MVTNMQNASVVLDILELGNLVISVENKFTALKLV